MADQTINQKIRKRIVQVLIILAIQALILFTAAGRWDWIMGWIYFGIYFGIILINSLVILPKNPELFAERSEMKEGTKPWDKWLAAIVSFYGPVSILVVAGLDHRFNWSAQPVFLLQLLGLLLFAAGYLFFSWAMASNKFFSGVVRIQHERGHKVASAGPYRIVRHPGYVGIAISSLGTPLLLGTAWAFIPSGLMVIFLIIRTAMEDRTLREELEGYREYTQKVRFRLFPGVW